MAEAHSPQDVGRLGYAGSAGGSGGRGELRLNRSQDILSGKTAEPKVGIARVSPLGCRSVQGGCVNGGGKLFHAGG